MFPGKGRGGCSAPGFLGAALTGARGSMGGGMEVPSPGEGVLPGRWGTLPCACLRRSCWVWVRAVSLTISEQLQRRRRHPGLHSIPPSPTHSQRRAFAAERVTCDYCSKKFTVDRLKLHLKYFCGPFAKRTAAQAKQERSRPTSAHGCEGGELPKSTCRPCSVGSSEGSQRPCEARDWTLSSSAVVSAATMLAVPGPTLPIVPFVQGL